MPRYIDADLFESHVQNEWEQNNISNGEWMDIREWLRDEPTIDAVPVVRCKDCKYWDEKYSFCINTEKCFGGETTPDWFCASGERRDCDEAGEN